MVARIPRGISNREDLFDVLEKELSLPSYFGRNWDALDECLGDFHWLKAKRVVMIHDDLPDLEEHQLTTYLEVLSDSLREPTRGEDLELVVVFPEETRPRVTELMEAKRPTQ
ncbi:barstar family protein [Thermodesulfobacteriota bacterium]